VESSSKPGEKKYLVKGDCFNARATLGRGQGRNGRHVTQTVTTVRAPLVTRMQYDKYDRDGSGLLDKSEVAELMREMGFACDDRHLDDLFEHFDTNKSGKIEFVEFELLWAKMMPLQSTRLRFLPIVKLEALFEKHRDLKETLLTQVSLGLGRIVVLHY
jgi:hypothetical protein